MLISSYSYIDLEKKKASIQSNKIVVLTTQYEVYCWYLDNTFICVLEQNQNHSLFTCFSNFFSLQKFFDLERENACASKEQKNHTFPKLNRNKYMVTDGAAYIGRCQGW